MWPFRSSTKTSRRTSQSRRELLLKVRNFARDHKEGLVVGGVLGGIGLLSWGASKIAGPAEMEHYVKKRAAMLDAAAQKEMAKESKAELERLMLEMRRAKYFPNSYANWQLGFTSGQLKMLKKIKPSTSFALLDLIYKNGLSRLPSEGHRSFSMRKTLIFVNDLLTLSEAQLNQKYASLFKTIYNRRTPYGGFLDIEFFLDNQPFRGEIEKLRDSLPAQERADFLDFLNSF